MLLAVLAAVVVGTTPPPSTPPTLQAGLEDYQALLDRYVRRVQPKGAPMDTRFDYEQLYIDEQLWTKGRSARLDRIHAGLLSARPSGMSEPERIAWAANTYNFLVIERVTTNLLIPRFGFSRYERVDQMELPDGRFFSGRLALVEGVKYTLDEFERRFVRGDSTRVPAPPALPRDLRLLFLTNPARIGHPPLMPRAFRADSLDRQMDAAVRATMALPRFASFDAGQRSLYVSDWLARSLGGSTAELLDFVRKWAPRAVRERMTQLKITDVARYLQADPRLNQREHPKVIVKPADKSGQS